MRYICEFQYSPVDYKSYANSIEELIEYQKREWNGRMGVMIGEKIGWEQYSANEMQRLKLEVQAFSQKDWSEFKQELKQHIQSMDELKVSTYPYLIVWKMIERLEMIGSLQSQPAAANPTRPVDNNQKQNDQH